MASLAGRLLSSERGVTRFKLAGLAVCANVFSKALAFVVLIYSTRIALDHLGADRFGVWMTISSVAVLLSFMDLGLSNALIGRVAELKAGKKSSSRLITAGLLALCAIGMLAAVLLSVLFALVPLTSWFKGIGDAVAAEARITGYVFAVLFGLSLPAQGLFKIYVGLQHGWVSNLASAFGWALSLLLIVLSTRFDAPMWFYLFATFGVQQLVSLGLIGGIARRGLLARPRELIGSWSALKTDALVQRGQMFLVIQIAVAVVWGSNQVILSAVIGPAEAAVFGVLQRYFMIVQVPLTLLNAPLWAMFADAHAHNEAPFIGALLKRSMAVTLFASLAGVALLVALGDVGVNLLAKNHVSVSAVAMGLMAVWTLLDVCGNAFSMYLNGVGAIRPQALTAIAYMIASLPMKVAGAYFLGLNGLLSVMIATYVLFTVIPFITIFRSECMSASRGIVVNDTRAAS